MWRFAPSNTRLDITRTFIKMKSHDFLNDKHAHMHAAMLALMHTDV